MISQKKYRRANTSCESCYVQLTYRGTLKAQQIRVGVVCLLQRHTESFRLRFYLAWIPTPLFTMIFTASIPSTNPMQIGPRFYCSVSSPSVWCSVGRFSDFDCLIIWNIAVPVPVSFLIIAGYYYTKSNSYLFLTEWPARGWMA